MKIKIVYLDGTERIIEDVKASGYSRYDSLFVKTEEDTYYIKLKEVSYWEEVNTYDNKEA